MTIMDIDEPYLLQEILKKMANTYGVMYLRFPRKGKTVYYSGTEEFQIGKGNIVRDGTDATVIACGIEVGYALEASGKRKYPGACGRYVYHQTFGSGAGDPLRQGNRGDPDC